jgi:hypothetical protein
MGLTMRTRRPNLYLTLFHLKGLLLFALLLGLFALGPLTAACTPSRTSQPGEILIGLKPEAVPALLNRQGPDPFNTGLASLDALNRTWDVQQMEPLFPDLSPDDEVAARQGLTGIFKLVVPAETNLDSMIAAYRSDPNVDYAELNQIIEAK